jgi:hypothetical protein
MPVERDQRLVIRPADLEVHNRIPHVLAPLPRLA